MVKAGGPVVKNVAGYDLAKLISGSFGTLGVIVDARSSCRRFRGSATCSSPPIDDAMLAACVEA